MRFPQRLRTVIAEQEHQQDGCAIWWNKSGKSFTLQPDLFEAVLQQSFGGNKFVSFHRKLNRWGFRRTIADSTDPVGSMTFGHLLFLRDEPEVQDSMTGVPPTRRQKRQAHQEAALSTYLRQHNVPFLEPDPIVLPSKRRRLVNDEELGQGQLSLSSSHALNLDMLFQEYSRQESRLSLMEERAASRKVVLDQVLVRNDTFFSPLM